MNWAELYQALTAQITAGETLPWYQDLFVNFYKAFLEGGRWELYASGVLTTLEVTILALIMGVILGVLVAVIRTAHDQQRPGRHNVVLAAQTTQEREEFEAIKKTLAEGHSLSVLESICDATRRRQQEALMISQQAEAMIVVGGKTSGNTRRLADVAESCGIAVWHIEVPEELPLEALKPYGFIGLTAGASTPRSIIDAVQESLKTL